MLIYDKCTRQAQSFALTGSHPQSFLWDLGVGRLPQVVCGGHVTTSGQRDASRWSWGRLGGPAGKALSGLQTGPATEQSLCVQNGVCVRDPGDAGPLPTQPHPGPLGSRAEKRAVPPVWKKPQNHSSFALGKQGPRFQKIMRNETTSWGPPSGPTGEGRCVGCTGPSQPGQPLLRREDAPQPFSPVHKAVTAPHP